jgi:FkbM family methyltransferase
MARVSRPALGFADGRSLANALARRHVSSVVMRIDRGVEVELPCTSDLASEALKGDFEVAHRRALHCLIDPGQCAIDVGANVGLMTCAMASSVGPHGKVIAVEPLPSCLRFLQRNIERNSFASRIESVPACASDSEGPIDVCVIPGREEYSSVSAIVHEAAAGQVTHVRVSGVTIDGIVRRLGCSPSLIKVDTEGHEARVLEGAKRTLADHRPVLSLELVPRLLAAHGSSFEAVDGHLRSAGLGLLTMDGTPLQAWMIGKRRFAQLLAVPEERRTECIDRLRSTRT